MAGTSTYLEAAILDYLTRDIDMPAKPATIYISLHTADPGQTGASEVSTSGTGYARVACTTGTAGTGAGSVFGAPAASGSSQQVANVSPITFPSPTGDWGTDTFFGVWDAATAGNFLLGAALTSSVHPTNGGAAPAFAAGELTISAS